MALGILELIFIILALLAAVGQFFLYRKNLSSTTNKWVFAANVALAVVIAYLAYSALPTNYTTQRTLALIWGFIPLMSLQLRTKSENRVMLSKAMLTLSMVAALTQLFL